MKADVDGATNRTARQTMPRRVRSRFVREHELLVGLRHRNLVGVHDLVYEGGVLAIGAVRSSGRRLGDRLSR
jgi:hypothetical protein